MTEQDEKPGRKRRTAPKARAGDAAPTIIDIARRAGVAPMTVSRALNRSDYVSEEVRERVLKAAQELNYQPNLQARSLRSNRTFILAILITNIDNPFWMKVVQGVEVTARENGYNVIICDTDSRPEREAEYIDMIIRHRVDGILIVPTAERIPAFEDLAQHRIPCVVIEREIDNAEIDMVLTDNEHAAWELTKQAIAQGHRRIGIITGPEGHPSAESRLAGYLKALREARIPISPGLIARGSYLVSTGFQGTAQLLAMQPRPTAIVACNNSLAAGVIIALSRHQVAIPDGMAVLAFDEMPILSAMYPSVIFAVQPAYDFGKVATELLIERVNGLDGPARRVTLETTLRTGLDAAWSPTNPDF